MTTSQARFPLGVIILLVGIFLSTLANAVSAPPDPPVPIIEVTGSGLSVLAPDMAIVRVGVTREAKTAREALDLANTSMQRVIKLLESKGIGEKDLQTENFSIRPRYRSPKSFSSGRNSSPAISGYTVANTLKITIRDLHRLGPILDAMVSLGVNSGGDISFSNSDPAPALQQARIRAMANAKDKARTLTRAAGVQLGRILSITENTARRSSPAMFAEPMHVKSGSGTVPLATGANSYQVQVTVRWAIIE